MVRRVGLLSTLLHEASARRPAEVLIETDRPVRMRLLDGSSAELGAAIGGTAISDELSELLSTEQQVDLALGEAVKFDLVVGPFTWHLVGETASEVVSVRACPQGDLFDASDSVQIPIEPDELDAQDIPRIRRTASSGPSEIDIDINFDDDAAAAHLALAEPLAEERPIAALRLAALRPVPADSKPLPAWPRQLVARSDAGVAGRAGPRSRRRPRPARAGPARVVAAAAPSRSASPRPPPVSCRCSIPRRRRRRRRRRRPRRRRRRWPRRARPRREDMAELLVAFEPGSLALLLRASGYAEAVAQALGVPSLAIGDADTREQATGRLGEIGEGGVLIIRAEDPSPWLPWLLRRIEEGRRAIVETEARTPAGARRTLLGVGAPPRAEQWLDAVRVLSATIDDGRWTLLSPGT